MPEQDPIRTVDQSVEISSLNRIPDLLRDDVREAVLALSLRPQGMAFLEKLGARKYDDGSDGFHGDGAIHCNEVDEMLESMRSEDRLSPRLEGQINKLRAHFGGMSSCLIEFGRVGSHFGEFDAREAILREKVAGGMYFDKYVLKKWLGRSTGVYSYKRIYEFTKEHTVVDGEEGGEEFPICKLEAGFFEDWSNAFFKNSGEVAELYRIVKKEGISIEFPFGKWVSTCKSHDDFAELFDATKDDQEFKRREALFTIWIRHVENYHQLKVWVLFAILSDVTPDGTAIDRLKDGEFDDPVLSSASFKKWMKEIFAYPEALGAASSSAWQEFYSLIPVEEEA